MLLGPNTLYTSQLGPPKPWGECGKQICGELYLNPKCYKLKIANHLKFEMFLKSKLVLSKGTCISLDFYFNTRLRENVLTLFIFNTIIQTWGLFHICIFRNYGKIKEIMLMIVYPMPAHYGNLILPQVLFQVE